jgi:hypothetical protein
VPGRCGTLRGGREHGDQVDAALPGDGQLVGMATVVASEQFFSPAKVASLHLLYVRKDALAGPELLLRALRRWAQAAGAEELNLSTTMGVGMDRSDRFLRKLGFRQTGGNYVLEGLG